MRTVLAEKTLGVARRILDSAKAGKPFDPYVLEWAREVLNFNPTPAVTPDPAETTT